MVIMLLVFLQVVLLLQLQQTETQLKPFGLSRSAKLNTFLSESAKLDDYGHSIAKVVAYMKGCFLEKITDSANGQIFKISRNVI